MPSLEEPDFQSQFHEYFVYSKKTPGFHSTVEQKFQSDAFNFLKVRRFNIDALKYVEAMEDFVEQYFSSVQFNVNLF